MVAPSRRPTPLPWLLGSGVIVACWAAGEVIAATLRAPLPGSVIGLVLLFALLRSPLGARVERLVRAPAAVLLALLPLLLVPLAVGVVAHVDEFLGGAAGLALAILGGWVVTLGVAAGLAALTIRGNAGNPPSGGTS